MSLGPELFLALAHNLNSRWLPARLNRVEAGPSWVALRLGGKDAWLLYSWDSREYGCGVIRDEGVSLLKGMRSGRSSLGEALKSNLQGAMLSAAERRGKDRILVLRAERVIAAGFPLSFSLLFEGMERKSNLILLDGEERILECAKHIHGDMNRFRTILPGGRYAPPPALKGREHTPSFSLQTPGDLRGLEGIGRGLAGLIEEAWDSYPPSSWERFVSSLLGEEAPEGLLLQKSGAYRTVFPVLLPGAEIVDGDVGLRCGDLLLSGMAGVQSRQLVSSARKILEREISGKNRLLDGLRKQRALAEKGDHYQKMGTLLLASMYSIPPRAKEAVLTDWDTGERVTVALDERLSPRENADRYFKRYRKGKVDTKALEERMRSVMESIAELEEQIGNLDAMADDPEVLAVAAQDLVEWLSPEKKDDVGGKRRKRKQETTPPHLRLRHGGCAIYVGVNARGNRHVTFRLASPGDLWFHAHDVPGAHVVVKEVDGPATPEALEAAASLAAWFSRARGSAKVLVDYTERRNVRSIPGSAIARVTYTNPRTLLVRPGLWKEHPEVAGSKVLEGRK